MQNSEHQPGKKKEPASREYLFAAGLLRPNLRVAQGVVVAVTFPENLPGSIDRSLPSRSFFLSFKHSFRPKAGRGRPQDERTNET